MMENSMNWLQLSVFFLCVLSGIWIYRKFNSNNTAQEGFSQYTPFELKMDNWVYDSFYAEEYDDLYDTETYADEDVAAIILYTHPSIYKSSFLDVGCGTGIAMQKLEQKHFATFGVDKSRFMVERAQERLQEGELICDDVLRDPMLYETGSFSHILCTHFTLYEIKDINTLFQHCFFWLKGGGFFIVHVVEPKKFNHIVPKSEMYKYTSPEEAAKITTTTIELDKYTYKNQYDMRGDNRCIQVEKFTTAHTTRQNEKEFFMHSKEEVTQKAMGLGFLVHAETQYKSDPYQSLVIFAKPH